MVVLMMAACSNTGPPGDLEPPDLFAWSQEKFELERFESAVTGFLSYMIRDPLNPLVDSAQYMAAEAQLRDGDVLEAIQEFRQLSSGRPNSPMADDAQYGACRAYLAAAPEVSLSQEFTRLALEECQRLLQFFPTTPFRVDAEKLIAAARAKLARQSYEIGKYYQKRELPESAIVYYEKSLTEGPADAFLPDLLERLYRSYSTVGFDTEAVSIRERLVSEFPDSEEAHKVREDATDPLEEMVGYEGSSDFVRPFGRSLGSYSPG